MTVGDGMLAMYQIGWFTVKIYLSPAEMQKLLRQHANSAL